MLIRETIMRKILNWPRLICQFFRADFLDISHQATGDASDEWKMRNLKRNGECRGISSVCRVLINRRWQPERNSLTSFTLDRWYPINFQIADPFKIGPRGGKDVRITWLKAFNIYIILDFVPTSGRVCSPNFWSKNYWGYRTLKQIKSFWFGVSLETKSQLFPKFGKSRLPFCCI